MHTFARRTAAVLSAKGLAALMAAFPMLASRGNDQDVSGTPPQESGGSAPETLNWDKFLSQIAALAEIQFTPGWDQDSYVSDVAKVMAALDLHDPTLMDFYADCANQVRGFPDITTIHHEPAFEVAVLQFEAGDTIGLHDHPDITGVLMCVTGAVEVESFNLLEECSVRGNPLLEHVETVTLAGGQIGTLTTVQKNIHALRAPVFTRLLDVFTPPYNDDRVQRSRWFVRSQEPYDGRAGIFEAKES